MMTNNGRISRRLLFLLIMFCSLPASHSSAQIDKWGYWQNGVSEPWWFSTAEFSSDEAARTLARWSEIGTAMQSSGQQWSGDYFQGSETHGTYIRWSPEAGFVMAHVNKCEARVMKVTYGQVRATAAVIEFIPEFRKGSQHHGKTHNEPEPLTTIHFLPVSWRGVRHLVPPEEISDFGAFAAGLGKYNVGLNPAGWIEYDFYYKLDGKESESANKLPIFPAGYERFVKNPIEATIEGLGVRRVKRVPTVGGPPFYESHSMVRINAGSESGVKRRMVFRVPDKEGDDTVEIIRVLRKSSWGRIVRTLDDNSSETYYEWDATGSNPFPKRYPRIAVGWRVTTAPK